MFVALRDLTFAKGRFALMGSVVARSPCWSGCCRADRRPRPENISAVTSPAADRIAFAAPSGGQDLSYADSTVTEGQWRRWAAPASRDAEPLGAPTSRGYRGDRLPARRPSSVSSPSSGLAPDRIDDRTVLMPPAAAEELGVRGRHVRPRRPAATVAATGRGVSFPVTPRGVDEPAHLARPSPRPPEGQEPTATLIALAAAPAPTSRRQDRAAGTETVTDGEVAVRDRLLHLENGSLQLMRGCSPSRPSSSAPSSPCGRFSAAATSPC